MPVDIPLALALTQTVVSGINVAQTSCGPIALRGNAEARNPSVWRLVLEVSVLVETIPRLGALSETLVRLANSTKSKLV